MIKQREKCGACVFHSSARICDLTRAVSPWTVDADGCRTRSVEGGVCVAVEHHYQREAERSRIAYWKNRQRRPKRMAMELI